MASLIHRVHRVVGMGSYVADKYIPASVQLSILSFSSNPSDMKFLKEISEKAAGNAEVIDQKIEVEVLQVLLRK